MNYLSKVENQGPILQLDPLLCLSCKPCSTPRPLYRLYWVILNVLLVTPPDFHILLLLAPHERQKHTLLIGDLSMYSSTSLLPPDLDHSLTTVSPSLKMSDHGISLEIIRATHQQIGSWEGQGMRLRAWDRQVSLVLPLPVTTECIGLVVKMRKGGVSFQSFFHDMRFVVQVEIWLEPIWTEPVFGNGCISIGVGRLGNCQNRCLNKTR